MKDRDCGGKVVTGVLGWLLPVIVAGMLLISACNSGSSGSDTEDGDSGNVSQAFAAGWVKEAGKRITDPNAWNPDIVTLAGGGYRMYFEREDANGDRNIYSALSSDGIVWVEENGTRIALANMPGAVATPGGQVRIYFSSGGGFSSSLSADGLVFINDGGIRLSPDEADETGGIKHPCVIRLWDNSYRMFYDAIDDDETNRIKTAVSNDGLAWTKQGVVIEPSDVMALGTPTLDVTASAGAVVDEDGDIRLFFTTRGPNAVSLKKGIYMATSTDDGVTFTVQTGPIISEFTTNDQDYGPQDATPVYTDEGLRVYYWIGTSEVEPLSAIYSVINASLEY